MEAPALYTSAGLGLFDLNGSKVLQFENSTPDPCCTLHEWLVLPPRGSTEFYADAAFSTLRAHAARKPNSHNGLQADGLDGSCSNRRRNAPYCRCSYLLIGGAIQCKLPQLALIIAWQGIAQQCPERVAKNVFQVHGITKDDEVVFNRPLRRAQVLSFFSKLEPCLIGMEACSSAHHWGRELTELGHDVRLIPPIYVKPYVKRGKSDAIDAEAICEAVTRPKMRFVAIKTVEQQSLLSIHRARNLLVRQRTQLINGLRGMVAEFGVYIARGLARVIGFAEDILAGKILDLPDIANEVIHNLCEHLMALHARVRWYEDRLKQVAKEDARVRLLRTILGVGAVTASAIIASIGDGHQFSNGREFAASC